ATFKSSVSGALTNIPSVTAKAAPIIPTYLGNRPRGKIITNTLSDSNNTKLDGKATTGLAQVPANVRSVSKNTASSSIALAAPLNNIVLNPGQVSPRDAPISNKG